MGTDKCNQSFLGHGVCHGSRMDLVCKRCQPGPGSLFPIGQEGPLCLKGGLNAQSICIHCGKINGWKREHVFVDIVGSFAVALGYNFHKVYKITSVML